MIDKNDLYPSTDTSIDPENEKAIQILDPEKSRKLNEWRTNNPQLSSIDPVQYAKILHSK